MQPFVTFSSATSIARPRSTQTRAAFINQSANEFGDHFTINHSKGEYVRGDVTTNHIENVFSVFKRGMRGVYQHCGEKHLHRYLSEFEFRYNQRTALGVTDVERAEAALRGIEGKRLTYRRIDSAPDA